MTLGNRKLFSREQFGGSKSLPKRLERIARKFAPKEFAEKLLFLLILLKIYFLISFLMAKQFNTRIDESLDLKLRLYAAHLSTTKAEAGARAMAQGIPTWVMAVPPSVARAMGDALPVDDASYERYLDEALAEEGSQK